MSSFYPHLPEQPIRIPQTHQQAVAAAQEAAAQIALLAEPLEGEFQPPLQQANLLSVYGVTALGVPAAHGGPGASVATQTEVVRIISAADGGIGQLLQLHNMMQRSLFLSSNEELKALLAVDLLLGKRFGNALAEVGGKNKFDFGTRLTRSDDGRLHLNGRKFYSTGCYLAHWIVVYAQGLEGTLTPVVVARDAPGVSVLDDWQAFGQRNSESGTTLFENVEVDERFVIRSEPRRTGLTFAQIQHAAIDTGIAAGALAAAVKYLRENARPWVESGVDKASEEPHVIRQVGEFAVAVRSAEALLAYAGATFDRHDAQPLDEDLQNELILAVAAARHQSDQAALRISSELFGLLGASASLEKWNLDRFWRNARVHTTHDPIRWRLHHVGDFYLNGTPPGEYNQPRKKA